MAFLFLIERDFNMRALLSIYKRIYFSIFFLGMLLGNVSWAHEYSGATFVMAHPFSYPSKEGQDLVPVYLRFISISGTDKLIGAECRYADAIELRANRDLSASAIPVISIEETQSFNIRDPNTPHILLKGMHLPFGFLRHYEMKLIFEKSGPMDVTISVGM